jgi:hypothetical protein
LRTANQAGRDAAKIARRTTGAREVQRVDERGAIRLPRRLHDLQRIRKAADLPPGHAFQIHAHPEVGREIAQRGDVGGQPGAVRVVAADAQSFGAELTRRFEHTG